MSFKRIDGRSHDQLRPYNFERNFIKTAEGSVLVSCGDTKVIVTAKIDPSLPPHLRNTPVQQGWITAEYAMLPVLAKIESGANAIRLIAALLKSSV